MSQTLTTTGTLDSNASTRQIAFVGDSGVGTTTVTTLVAARLAERTGVTVTGDATRLVEGSDHNSNALGIEWTVHDCVSSVDAIDTEANQLNTVFVVVTPETLESYQPYFKRASEHGINCFLVVNRFRDSARNRIQAFEGPEIAEYVYENAEISTAISDGRIPVGLDRTVEAILIEALQPERLAAGKAVAALEAGRRSVVNVEVGEASEADAIFDSFDAAGFPSAYFDCNCCCHDGHIIARRPPDWKRRRARGE